MVEGDRMVGVPFALNSSIDPYGDVDATATDTHRLMIVGDWSHFVILDRVGMSVSFLPPGVLQNTANNLPDGRVGWYIHWRTTSKVLGIDPFRLLKLTTAA